MIRTMLLLLVSCLAFCQSPNNLGNTVVKDFLINIAKDQQAIHESALTIKDNPLVSGLVAANIGALVAYDNQISKGLPNTHNQISFSKIAGNVGAGVIAGVPAYYLISSLVTTNKQTRDTSILALESLVDTWTTTSEMKVLFLRQRPDYPGSSGQFFKTTSDPSFPSQHSALAWSVASVVAHRSNKKWVKALSYGIATGISLSRVSARRHFMSDVVVGSAIGYQIGAFVSSNRSY